MAFRHAVALRGCAFVPAALLCLLFVSDCDHRPLPDPANRETTRALDDPSGTRLHAMLVPFRDEDGGGSGFTLVESGPEALSSLRSLIATADRTLDLQYYIWQNDDSGRLLLAELLDAAERGVRVRLLLDDLKVAWPDDELRRLNAHPHLEIRVFNPISRARGKLLDALLDFDRITNRMHNKLFVADNLVAVMGGRNISDQYFASDERANFRDLDVHVVGPVVRDLSASFDSFWNSGWSLSVATLADDTPEDRREVAARTNAQALKRVAGLAGATEKAPDVDAVAHRGAVFDRLIRADWALVVADAPDKPRTDHSKLLAELAEKMPAPQSEVLLETAYFVPGETGLAALCDLVASGVRLRILTNSYASIDAITAYAGYRKYREGLVRCGAELYELRPDGEAARRDWTWYGTDSSSILHTKAALIDRRYLFIGSLNHDPRSNYLNTEIAILIDSQALAEKVLRFMAEGVSSENAWALGLEDDELVWQTVDDGKTVRRTDEPDLDPWGQFVSWIINLLPIERQI